MRAQKRKKPEATPHAASGFSPQWDLGFGFGLQHLATTVEASGANVVAQVDFTGGGFYGDTGHNQSVVRTVHAALGGRFFVLLNCHGGLLVKNAAQAATR
jgi:hypothetical protein